MDMPGREVTDDIWPKLISSDCGLTVAWLLCNEAKGFGTLP